MKKETLRRADLLFSIVLIVVSIWFGVKSVLLFSNPFSKDWSLLTQEEIDKNLADWFNSPGLIPLIFSICLLVCAIVLMRIAIKEGARLDFLQKDKIVAFFRNKEFNVAVKVIGLLAIYLYGIIPFCRRFLNLIPTFQGFPFLIATFIYLAAFIILFNEKTVKKIVISLVVAGTSSTLITVGFGVVAKILLP